MRKTFIQTLTKLAADDERIVLLTADLGYTVLEVFAEAHPARFFNVGVAEQNMVGIATGLAEAGMLPFVYSIATFATLRPYEFIRNGPIKHNLPVRVIGVGGGFEYGSAGLSHYAVEDVGVMRLQPGIDVVVPADYQQTRTALVETWDLPNPVYYRIGKNEQITISQLNGQYTHGSLNVVSQGEQILLLAMGGIAHEVSEAVKSLKALGINPSFAVVPSVVPSPSDELAKLLDAHGTVVTVEEHYVKGGLGSLVAEVIADEHINSKLHRLGIQQKVSGVTGTQRYLLKHNQLDAESIARFVQQLAVNDHQLEAGGLESD